MHYDESSGTFREVVGSSGEGPSDYTEVTQFIQFRKAEEKMPARNALNWNRND